MGNRRYRLFYDTPLSSAPGREHLRRKGSLALLRPTDGRIAVETAENLAKHTVLERIGSKTRMERSLPETIFSSYRMSDPETQNEETFR